MAYKLHLKPGQAWHNAVKRPAPILVAVTVLYYGEKSVNIKYLIFAWPVTEQEITNLLNRSIEVKLHTSRGTSTLDIQIGHRKSNSQ